MNKIQMIKLLEMRGVTELKGESINDAIQRTGGEPGLEEMVKVNHAAMMWFAEKHTESESKNADLLHRIAKLEEKETWLRCLEAAGVDNWEGYDQAIDIRDGISDKRQ